MTHTRTEATPIVESKCPIQAKDERSHRGGATPILLFPSDFRDSYKCTGTRGLLHNKKAAYREFVRSVADDGFVVQDTRKRENMLRKIQE